MEDKDKDDSLTADQAESIASSRSRRSKSDKFGRLAALQKLRELKGGKNKYQVSSVSAVYEEVDEREYSRRRRDKMEEDWIVDDDGSGYVEDGREIFDEEDDDDQDLFTSKKGGSKRGGGGGKEAKAKKEAKGNIKNMLINMPVKKRKAESVGLDEDELLGDILQDLGGSPAPRPSFAKKPRPSHSPSKTYASPINPFATKHAAPASSPNPRANSSSTTTPTRPSHTSSTNSFTTKGTSSPVVQKASNGANLAGSNRAAVASPGLSLTGRGRESNGSGDNKGTPIITTPVRGTTRQPRTVLRENAPVSPPKAKRSLAEVVSKPAVKEETEADFADMDFTELGDDMMDEFLPVSAAGAAVQDATKAEPVTPVKDEKPAVAAHRGFTASTASSGSSSSQASAGWEGLKGSGASSAAPLEQIVIPELSLDTSKLPLVTADDGSQVLRMYWLDAYEEPYRQPGTVFLFGKVWIETARQHVSCCVSVRNIPRKIFLLPRAKRINVNTNEVLSDVVTMKDVYDEFNDRVTKRFDIKEFKSRPVKKSYAFDKADVPNEADYLEVRYSASHDAVPKDLCGETFSHVFGWSSSSLETLLLDLRLKGPCWLEVANPQTPRPPLSWCKVEAVANTPGQLRLSSCSSAAPPTVVLTLTLRTTLNTSSHQSEVAAVGCLVHHSFPLDKKAPSPAFQQHFCVLTKPSDVAWPYDFKTRAPRYQYTKVEKTDTERALLGFLLAKIQQLDPDVIVGHDILGYDLSILLNRIAVNKISHWSRIGRLKRTQMPKLASRGGYGERTALCGRLVCDVKLSAKELIKAKTYDLAPLAAQVLPGVTEEAEVLLPAAIKKMYDSSDSLLQLVSLTMLNSFHVVGLLCELNVLPLALQITNIAGNVLSRTLLGGRSERNEFLLLHAFTERNYIPPDKEPAAKNKVAVKESAEDGGDTVAQPGRKKAAYAGGLVLEPKRGFYDKYVLCLDFNSLYPSIIQEYNICFTTVDRQRVAAHSDEGVIHDLPEPDQPAGVLPTEIRKLVESRREVKKLMKAPGVSLEAKTQFDIRQQALKLTANSMYGCLGFTYSRFHAEHLAAMITGKGREILLQTRDLVQKTMLNLDVIYGDTDSIMINTNSTDYDQVLKLGVKIKNEVNKLYRLLELDVDGVFKYMLLLKKKKYAALAITVLPNGRKVEKPELKGLDIVRRDWSQLACNAGKHVVDQILSDQQADERVNAIHTHLAQLAQQLRDGQMELSELVISKQLTKRPEDYPDKAALPHVQVALRLNKTGGKKLKQGDTVPYVICLDDTNNSHSQRAYHPDELKSNAALRIDTDYYLAHQLHPVVARICDPIDGSDAARIAECLGLDPSHYRSARQYQQQDGGDEDEKGVASELPPDERYRGCQRFTFTCPVPACDTRVTMDAPFRTGVGSALEPVLQSCPNPKCQQPLYASTAPLSNALTKDIRAHIKRYYDGWLVCEDPGCSNRSKRVPLQFIRGFPICNTCRRGVLIREFTESQLYKQLCFYDYIFDFQKACIANKDDRIRDDNLRRAYAALRAEVQRFLDMSAYSQVDLGSLFGNLYLKCAKG